MFDQRESAARDDVLQALNVYWPSAGPWHALQQNALSTPRLVPRSRQQLPLQAAQHDLLYTQSARQGWVMKGANSLSTGHLWLWRTMYVKITCDDRNQGEDKPHDTSLQIALHLASTG
jgi:hypothetical protein